MRVGGSCCAHRAPAAEVLDYLVFGNERRAAVSASHAGVWHFPNDVAAKMLESELRVIARAQRPEFFQWLIPWILRLLELGQPSHAAVKSRKRQQDGQRLMRCTFGRALPHLEQADALDQLASRQMRLAHANIVGTTRELRPGTALIRVEVRSGRESTVTARPLRVPHGCVCPSGMIRTSRSRNG
jgi:hypothetical protein